MRASRREVNIFNMSLLDILCGALGAFCFLTLTLFPFYGSKGHASSVAAEGLEEELAAAQRRLETVRREQRDSPAAARIASLAARKDKLNAAAGQLESLEQQRTEVRRTLDEARARSGAAERLNRAANAEEAGLRAQLAQMERMLQQPPPRDQGLFVNGRPLILVAAIHNFADLRVESRQAWDVAGQASSGGGKGRSMMLLAGLPAGSYRFQFSASGAPPQPALSVFACGRPGCRLLQNPGRAVVVTLNRDQSVSLRRE